MDYDQEAAEHWRKYGGIDAHTRISIIERRMGWPSTSQPPKTVTKWALIPIGLRIDHDLNRVRLYDTEFAAANHAYYRGAQKYYVAKIEWTES